MERRDLDIIYGSSVNWQMYRNKSVMITGATGRLGRYIMETLVDADLRYNLNMCILVWQDRKRKQPRYLRIC